MIIKNNKVSAIAVSVAAFGILCALPLYANLLQNSYANTQPLARGITVATDPTTAQDSDIVRIADTAVKARVKEVLGNTKMSDDEITFGKVKNITALDVQERNITKVTSLEGLQFFTSLESAAFLDGTFSDLTPISNLTTLKTLLIGRNVALKNATPLQNLTNLEQLFIYRNDIQDFSFVKNLSKLKVLVADYNATHFSNVDFVSNSSNLEVLQVAGNGISDISALSNLTKLTNFNISANKIANFSPLRDPVTQYTVVQKNTGRLAGITGWMHNQVVSTSTTSKIFKNPLQDDTGNSIPVSESNDIINVDSRGNVNKNGGYIKLVSQSGVGSLTVAFSKTIPLTGGSRSMAGNLTINYDLETDPPVFNQPNPPKIVARKGTSIEGKIAEVTATDIGSGLKGDVSNNSTTINLDPKNPSAGIYTLIYTAIDNNDNSSSVSREIEIVDADELDNKITEAKSVNPAKYTTESIDELNRTLDDARKVFENPNSTQAEVDKAKAELQEAINNLKEKPTEVTPQESPVETKPQEQAKITAPNTGSAKDSNILNVFIATLLPSAVIVPLFTIFIFKKNKK